MRTKTARTLGQRLRRRWIPALRDTYRAWSEDDGPLLSAAMAFYAAFSLFPLILVLISVLGLVMRFSDKVQGEKAQLLELVGENTTPWLADQLASILAGVETSAAVNGPLGIFGLILAAIGIFKQMEGIFDRIWREHPPKKRGLVAAIKGALFERFFAFLMLLCVGGLIVVLLLADMALTTIRPYVVQLPAGQVAWTMFQLAVGLALNAGLFTLLYRTLPKQHVQWSAAAGGGLVVAIFWEVGQMILGPMIIGEKYSAYGVVGSFIAIMLWLYLASALLFIGAEFVQILNRDAHGPADREQTENLRRLVADRQTPG